MRHRSLALFLPLLLAFGSQNTFAQTGQGRRLRVMEWNVENLFDTIDAPSLQDDAFTPTGANGWTSGRYWGKLGRLARTIANAGELQPVDLVGLCEVENDSVLRDLTERTYLHRLGYERICASTSDVRGISVALLYNPLRFRPLAGRSIAVPHEPDERPTRHILHVCGEAVSGDTLDVFVVHFPSRSGGRKSTEPYRRRAARLVRSLIDSICAARPAAACLVMGDFNDEYRNAAIRRDLGAQLMGEGDAAPADGLIDLAASSKKGAAEGTYVFRGRWNLLDHILVSASLLNGRARLQTSPADCRIYAPPALRESSPHTAFKPRRAYLGTFYQGGTSDHFPLLLDLWW